MPRAYPLHQGLAKIARPPHPLRSSWGTRTFRPLRIFSDYPNRLFRLHLLWPLVHRRGRRRYRRLVDMLYPQEAGGSCTSCRTGRWPILLGVYGHMCGRIGSRVVAFCMTELSRGFRYSKACRWLDSIFARLATPPSAKQFSSHCIICFQSS